MLTDWMDLASCQNIDDPEKFFDLYLQSDEVVSEVQLLCATCPVKIECLNYGLNQKCTGVWGGRFLQNGKITKKIDVVVSDYFWKDEDA